MNDIRSRREDILQLADSHGAKNVRVFGSIVRDQAGPESDIDFLVRMKPDRSLLDRIGLIQDLQDLLQNPVDVVNERALHRAIRDEVLSEAISL